MDMRLEVIVIPVADVDRAKQFYKNLGWREDAEFVADETFRIVQLTPPGSACSIIFGTGVTAAAPGSVQNLVLAVTDVEAARADLLERGAQVSGVYHDAGGVFYHAGTEKRVDGPDPERRSYCSFASFSDPDGNGWVLQELTTRLPGR
jgi:catechol 2,3-dioxygenase-like lactoylglutathione lyase family enzyme